MNDARKHHALTDAKEPNLLEDTYPYSLPPLIRLEGPVVEYIDGKAVEFDGLDDGLFIPGGETVFAVGDRVIVFALPKALSSVEKLFA